MHFTHSCYKRSKSAHNRDKPGYNYGLASILFIKFMCFIQMTLFEYSGIGIIEQFTPEEMPYHIITRISQNCGEKQDQNKNIYLKRHPG